MGADIDCASLRIMAPDVDFNDPKQGKIVVNTGGIGGIHGCQAYITYEYQQILRKIKWYLKNEPTKKLYICSNNIDCVLAVEKFVLEYTKKVYVMHLGRQKKEHQMELAKDAAGFLNSLDCMVFICSPQFSTAFSLDKWASVTFGLMFTYPIIIIAFLQMLARARLTFFKKVYLYMQRKQNVILRKSSDRNPKELCLWYMNNILTEYNVGNSTYADIVEIANDPARLRGAWQEYDSHWRSQDLVSISLTLDF
jgi:hypothetical protein